jgi:hypothetical protein
MTANIPVFLLGVVIVVFVALFVAAPLFQPPEAAVPDDEERPHERWLRQKRLALEAIKEVELDHQMGKLSDEDLATMRTKFEREALEAMAALEGTAPRATGAPKGEERAS